MKIRGTDKQGSGAWLASRGNRKHLGEDIICNELEEITSHVAGFVSKIGYPYNPSNIDKGHLRYIEVTDKNKSKVRYFYLFPTVEKGQKILKGDILGISQDLTKIYNGITQHYHLEVIAYLQPTKYLGEST